MVVSPAIIPNPRSVTPESNMIKRFSISSAANAQQEVRFFSFNKNFYPAVPPFSIKLLFDYSKIIFVGLFQGNHTETSDSTSKFNSRCEYVTTSEFVDESIFRSAGYET